MGLLNTKTSGLRI